MQLEPDQLANCLSDVTRLRIISLLHLQGERCVCEIVASLGIPQPKASKHLGILRSAGLIRPRREGHWIHYKIDPEMPAWANLVIEHLVSACATRSPYRDDCAHLEQARLGSSCA